MILTEVDNGVDLTIIPSNQDFVDRFDDLATIDMEGIKDDGIKRLLIAVLVICISLGLAHNLFSNIFNVFRYIKGSGNARMLFSLNTVFDKNRNDQELVITIYSQLSSLAKTKSLINFSLENFKVCRKKQHKLEKKVNEFFAASRHSGDKKITPQKLEYVGFMDTKS